VVKIATFAKPQNVMRNKKGKNNAKRQENPIMFIKK
jgi:hypothetical protein